MERKQVDTQRVPIYACISNAGAVIGSDKGASGNFVFSLKEALRFKPDYCVVAQFNMINTSAPNSMYVLSSSINNEPLLLFNGFSNTYYSSNTPFRVYNNITNNINFNIQQVATDGSLTMPIMSGTWYLAMILEFSKTATF